MWRRIELDLGAGGSKEESYTGITFSFADVLSSAVTTSPFIAVQAISLIAKLIAPDFMRRFEWTHPFPGHPFKSFGHPLR